MICPQSGDLEIKVDKLAIRYVYVELGHALEQDKVPDQATARPRGNSFAAASMFLSCLTERR